MIREVTTTEKAAVDAALSRSKDVLASLGLAFPKSPLVREDIEFPVRMGDLSPEALSEQLSYWTSLASWGFVQAALLDAAASVATMEFEQEFDLRYSTETHGSVTDKRHEVCATDAVRNKRRVSVQLTADAKIVRAVANGYEKNYSALSRELTRRGQAGE